RPITVVVFREDNSYKPFKPLYQGKPADVSGYFQASDDAVHITLAADWQQSFADSVMFHEYVHVLTSNGARSLPTWLNEGIAEYYSAFEISGDRKIRVGKPIAGHIRLLRERPLMPLATLLAVNEASPLYNESDKKNLFYAESWALVHYLMLGKEGGQEQFRQFINALREDKPADESFRQAFQAPYETIEQELRNYLQRNLYRDQQVIFDREIVFDSSMSASLLSKAEVQAHLGDLLWHIQRAGEAETFLNRALALDPKLALAHRSLGMLRFGQRSFTEASRHFRQAAESNPRDYLAHYYHALSLQQEQADEMGYVSGYPDETVKAMRASLEKARELAPEFAETYKQLAFIYLVLGENLDEAVGLLKQALALAPDREEFRYTLARVYLRRQNYAAARQTAEQIAGSGSKSVVCERARNLLDVIAQVEEGIARAKAESAARGGQTDAASNSANAPPPLPGKRFEGEQLRGLLTRIDCTDASVTLTVKSDARIFRFHKPKFGDLVFVRYTIEIPITITCGAIAPARPVIVTYRKTSGDLTKSDGEPVGVEFVKPDL
ncbi:MAG: tetratricopeptide repeat protein, partial [Blastocatellia bacterium]